MYRIPLTESPQSWGATRLFVQNDTMRSGIFRCDPGSSLPLHTHETADEYIYPFQGTGGFVVGEEQFESGPGEVVRIPRGAQHRCYATSDEPFVCFFLVCP